MTVLFTLTTRSVYVVDKGVAVVDTTTLEPSLTGVSFREKRLPIYADGQSRSTQDADDAFLVQMKIEAALMRKERELF